METAVGARVRALREAKGWSQQEIADRMKRRGFDWMQSTVAKTEAAARPIRINEAFALARVFDESINALIYEESVRGNLEHAVFVAEDAVAEAESRVQDAEQALQQARRALEKAEESRDRRRAKLAAYDAKQASRG